MTDPKTWLFFLCGVATQVVNGAASNFGRLIIAGFGYSNLVTTLFQIPYGMVILVSNVSAMYIQRWLPGQKRCLVAVLYVCPALAGAVGIHTISRNHKAALLVCYWVCRNIASHLRDFDLTSFRLVDQHIHRFIRNDNVSYHSKYWRLH